MKPARKLETWSDTPLEGMHATTMEETSMYRRQTSTSYPPSMHADTASLAGSETRSGQPRLRSQGTGGSRLMKGGSAVHGSMNGSVNGSGTHYFTAQDRPPTHARSWAYGQQRGSSMNTIKVRRRKKSC